jgi:hypothetical protein
MNDQKDELYIAELIGKIPEHEMPEDLSAKVIRSLKPKKLSIWRRLYLIAKRPKMITITPLRAATSMLSILIVFAVVLKYQPQRLDTADTQNDLKMKAVTFELEAMGARSVNLIGSFNGWKPEKYEMRKNPKNNKWIIEIRIPTGSHEYAFLIDNKQSIPDPNSVFYKNDGFNSRNSLLYVSSDNESVL